MPTSLVRCFNINRGVSFTLRLGSIGCLWAGPQAKNVGLHMSFKGHFLNHYSVVSLRTQNLLLYKIRCFGAHLSGTGLKSWSALCGIGALGIGTLHSNWKSSHLIIFSSSLCWGLSSEKIRLSLWQYCVPTNPTNFYVAFFSFVWCAVTTRTDFGLFFKRKLLYM